MNPLDIQYPSVASPTMTGFNPNAAVTPYNQMTSLLNDLQTYQPYLQPDTTASYTPFTKETPKGNWFTNNLATGLGIGGSLLGSLAGPGGTIAGGALGAGLGKGLENLFEEGKVNTGDVAKEAAVSGALGLVGAGAGKVAGKAGQALLGTKFPSVAGEAIIGAEQAGRQGLKETGKQALKKAIGNDAVQTAEQVATKPSAAARYGARFLQGAFNNTIDEPTARDLYIKYGIKKPAEAIGIKNIVTGSADAGPGQALVNKVVENAVAKSGGSFDPTDLASGLLKSGLPQRGGTIAENLINQLPANAISDRTERKLYQEFAKTVKDLLGAQVGRQEASGLQALEASRVFAQKAATVAGDFRNPEARYVAQVYRNFADELADRALSPAGKNILLSPAEKQTLVEAITPAIEAVNPKAAAGILDDITKATSLRDFRALQSKWVQAGRAAEDIALASSQKAGITASGIGEAMSTPVRSTGRAVGSFAGRRLDKSMPGLLQAASNLAQSAGLTNPGLQTTIGAVGLPAATNTITNYETPNTGGAATMDMAQAAGGMGGRQAPGPSALPQEPGMAGGVSDLQRAYMGLAAFNPSLMGAMTMTDAQRQSSQNAVQAINAVDTLGKTLLRAGGGQGPIGGTISKLKGKVGGNAARTFQQEKAKSAIAIAQALNTTPQEVAGLLPDLTDTDVEAAGKIETLKNQLRTTLQASQQTGLSGLGFSGVAGSPSLLSGLMR